MLRSLTYGPSSNTSAYQIDTSSCSVYYTHIQCRSVAAKLGVQRTNLSLRINIDGYTEASIEPKTITVTNVEVKQNCNGVSYQPVGNYSGSTMVDAVQQGCGNSSCSHTIGLGSVGSPNCIKRFKVYYKCGTSGHTRSVTEDSGDSDGKTIFFTCNLKHDVSTAYKRPTISSLWSMFSVSAKPELSTAGGSLIVVSGSDFGPPDQSYPTKSLHGTNGVYCPPDGRFLPCNENATCTSKLVNCSVQSHSVMWCVSIESKVSCPRARSNVYVSIVGETSAHNSNAFLSFKRPSISHVAATDRFGLSTSGSEVLTLTGTDFGNILEPNISVGYFRYNVFGGNLIFVANSCNVTVAHKAIACLTVPGIGRNLTLNLTVVDLSSDTSAVAISYAPPSISDLQILNGGNFSLLPTNGSRTLFNVSGASYGPTTSRGFIKIEFWYGTQRVWESARITAVDQTFVFAYSPDGVGGGFAFRIQVGGQYSQIYSGAGLSYAPPILMSWNATAAGIKTNGGETVRFIGDNFGVIGTRFQVSTVPKVVDDFKSCRISAEHTAIDCQTPEGDGEISILITVVSAFGANQSSTGNNGKLLSVRYGLPKLSKILRNNLRYFNATNNVTVFGENFGRVASRKNLTFSKGSEEITCTNLQQNGTDPHGHISCTVTTSGVDYTSGDYAPLMFVRDQRNNPSVVSEFLYATEPTKLFPQFACETGGTYVSVSGNGFPREGFMVRNDNWADPSLKVDGQPSVHKVHTSHLVTFTLPSMAVGTFPSWTFNMAGSGNTDYNSAAGNLSQIQYYRRPTLSGLTPWAGPSGGGMDLQFFGNFTIPIYHKKYLSVKSVSKSTSVETRYPCEGTYNETLASCRPQFQTAGMYSLSVSLEGNQTLNDTVCFSQDVEGGYFFVYPSKLTLLGVTENDIPDIQTETNYTFRVIFDAFFFINSTMDVLSRQDVQRPYMKVGSREPQQMIREDVYSIGKHGEFTQRGGLIHVNMSTSLMSNKSMAFYAVDNAAPSEVKTPILVPLPYLTEGNSAGKSHCDVWLRIPRSYTRVFNASIYAVFSQVKRKTPGEYSPEAAFILFANFSHPFRRQDWYLPDSVRETAITGDAVPLSSWEQENSNGMQWYTTGLRTRKRHTLAGNVMRMVVDTASDSSSLSNWRVVYFCDKAAAPAVPFPQDGITAFYLKTTTVSGKMNVAVFAGGFPLVDAPSCTCTLDASSTTFSFEAHVVKGVMQASITDSHCAPCQARLNTSMHDQFLYLSALSPTLKVHSTARYVYIRENAHRNPLVSAHPKFWSLTSATPITMPAISAAQASEDIKVAFNGEQTRPDSYTKKVASIGYVYCDQQSIFTGLQANDKIYIPVSGPVIFYKKDGSISTPESILSLAQDESHVDIQFDSGAHQNVGDHRMPTYNDDENAVFTQSFRCFKTLSGEHNCTNPKFNGMKLGLSKISFSVDNGPFCSASFQAVFFDVSVGLSTLNAAYEAAKTPVQVSVGLVGLQHGELFKYGAGEYSLSDSDNLCETSLNILRSYEDIRVYKDSEAPIILSTFNESCNVRAATVSMVNAMNTPSTINVSFGVRLKHTNSVVHVRWSDHYQNDVGTTGTPFITEFAHTCLHENYPFHRYLNGHSIELNSQILNTFKDSSARESQLHVNAQTLKVYDICRDRSDCTAIEFSTYGLVDPTEKREVTFQTHGAFVTPAGAGDDLYEEMFGARLDQISGKICQLRKVGRKQGNEPASLTFHFMQGMGFSVGPQIAPVPKKRSERTVLTWESKDAVFSLFSSPVVKVLRHNVQKVYEGGSDNGIPHYRCKTKVDNSLYTVSGCAEKAQEAFGSSQGFFSVQRPNMDSAPFKDRTTTKYQRCFEKPWPCPDKYYGYDIFNSDELECFVYNNVPSNITKVVREKEFSLAAHNLCRNVEINEEQYSRYDSHLDDIGCSRYAGLYKEKFKGVTYRKDNSWDQSDNQQYKCAAFAPLKSEKNLMQCASAAAALEPPANHFLYYMTQENKTCFLPVRTDDVNLITCPLSTERYTVAIEPNRFTTGCLDCDAAAVINGMSLGGSCNFPSFVETYVVEPRSNAKGTFSAGMRNVFAVFDDIPSISDANRESYFFNSSFEDVQFRFVISAQDFARSGLSIGAPVYKIRLLDSPSGMQSAPSLEEDLCVYNVTLRYKVVAASTTPDDEAFKDNTGFINFGRPLFSCRGGEIIFRDHHHPMVLQNPSESIVFHLSRSMTGSDSKQFNRGLVLKRALSIKSSVWAKGIGDKPNILQGLKSFTPGLAFYTKTVAITFKTPLKEAFENLFQGYPVAPSFYNVTLSIDGTRYRPEDSQILQLRNSNSGLENLSPEMGSVKGGGVVNLYGTGLESVDSKVTVRWKVKDDLLIYMSGIKRLDAGAAYIATIIPQIYGVEKLLGDANEMKVRIDTSSNDQVYFKEHFNKGKYLNFRFHREPFIVNATCIDTPEGRCLGNTLFEQGNVRIKVFAKRVWHTNLLKCKFTSETEQKVVDASSSYKNEYKALSSFFCDAPKMRRGVVSLTISNNGVEYFGPTEDKVVFVYRQCLGGFKALFYYDKCEPCEPGTKSSIDGKTCPECELHTYNPKLAALSCEKCPRESITSTLGSTSRYNCTCRKEFYALNVSWPACKSCPEYSNCSGGWTTPRPNPGFWRTPQCTNRIGCDRAFLKCKPDLACPGLDSNNCGPGYTGKLCGRCIQGYYRRNQYCRACPSGTGVGTGRSTKPMDPFGNIVYAGVIFLVTLSIQIVFSRDETTMTGTVASVRSVVALIYSIVLLAGVNSIVQSVEFRFSNPLLMVQLSLSLVAMVIFYSFSSYIGKIGSVFIVFNFLQIFFVFSRYEIPWMPTHKYLFDFIADYLLPITLYPSFVESIALECYTDKELNFKDTYSLHILGIVCELAFVSIIYLGHACFIGVMHVLQAKFGFQQRFTWQKRLEIETKKLLNVQAVILEMGLVFVLNSNTGLFTCTTQPDGTVTIDAQPSEYCVYDAHTQMGQLYVTVYVIGVIFLLLMSVDSSSRLSLMGKRFRQGAKPWHLIVLMRTLTSVFVASFLDKSFDNVPYKTLPVIQCGMTMMMLLINLCMHLIFEPYKDSHANASEVFFLGSSFLTIFCGLLFKTGDFPEAWINVTFDLMGSITLILVTSYVVVQVCVASSNRLFFERAKALTFERHGVGSSTTCMCLLQKRCFRRSRKTGVPTSVDFLHHVLAKLLDEVGGDGLPRDQVDLLLSRHSLFRGDLLKILKSLSLHWLDSRYDTLTHTAETSVKSKFIRALPAVRFQKKSRLSCMHELFSLLAVLAWVLVIIVAFMGLDYNNDGITVRLVAIYLPRFVIVYNVLILVGRYLLMLTPRCKNRLQVVEQHMHLGTFHTNKNYLTLCLSRAGKRCGCFAVAVANVYALLVLLFSIVSASIRLVFAIILKILRAPLSSLLQGLEAFGLPAQVSNTLQFLLFIVLVNMALLNSIPSVSKPTYYGDIAVIAADVTFYALSTLLGHYGQHEDLKILFQDIRFKLYFAGILSIFDVLRSQGFATALYFFCRGIGEQCCRKVSPGLKRKLSSLRRMRSSRSSKSQSAESDLDNKETVEMQVLFDALCNEGQRELDREGIRAVFQAINGSLEARNKSIITIEDKAFEEIFLSVDVDNSGSIDFQEFLRFISMIKSGKLSSIDVKFDIGLGDMEAAQYKRFFDEADVDGNGELDEDEIRKLFHLINDDRKSKGEEFWSFTNDQIDRLFAEIDADKSGTVDFSEFTVLINRLQNGDLRDIIPDFKGYRRMSIRGSENNRYLHLFKLADENETGELDYVQAKSLFDRVNEDRDQRGEVPFSLDGEKFGELFAEIDVDKSGSINFQEFLGVMEKIKKGNISNLIGLQFSNMISLSKRKTVTSTSALKYIEDNYDQAVNFDLVERLRKKSPTMNIESVDIMKDPSYFPLPDDIQDFIDFVSVLDGRLDFITPDLMLGWIYSSRSSVKEIMTLRAAVIKVVEEDRNNAESEHCSIVRTRIKRSGEIVGVCQGDWDVLCFDGDHIVYDLAICDTDGVLLEKPSARTKVAIEVITQEFSNRFGKLESSTISVSPVVQFHNTREQISATGSAFFNASVEIALPMLNAMRKLDLFSFTVRMFLNQELVSTSNDQKSNKKRKIILQHYKQNQLEYDMAPLKESLHAGEEMMFVFNSKSGLRGVGEWVECDGEQALVPAPSFEMKGPLFSVSVSPKFDLADDSSSAKIASRPMYVTIEETINTADELSVEMRNKKHAPRAGVLRETEQVMTVHGFLAGEYEFSVLQDGSHIPGSPWNINLCPLEVDMSKSSFVPLKFYRPDKPGLRGEKALSGSGMKFLVVLRDKYWNIIRPGNFTGAKRWKSRATFRHGNYAKTTPFHVEALSAAYSGNGQANFKPAVLSDLAVPLRKAGLSRCRLASAQILKEKRYLERLVLYRKNVDDDSFENAYLTAIQCPLLADERQCQGLTVLSMPHGRRGSMAFSDVFLITRRPMRGPREPFPDPLTGATYRPSVMLDSNTYMWFPTTSGDYSINFWFRGDDGDSSGVSVLHKKRRQNISLRFEYKVTLRGALANDMGSVRWLLRHKVFRKEKVGLGDILALNIWPALLKKQFLANFISCRKEKVEVHSKKELGTFHGAEKQKALDIKLEHDIITDVQYFKQIWPVQLDALGTVTSVNDATRAAYVAKLLMVSPKFSNGTAGQLCNSLSLLSNCFQDLNTKSGILSDKNIRWRSLKEKSALSIGLATICSIFDLLNKMQSNMVEEKFFTWWKGVKDDPKLLMSQPSFRSMHSTGDDEHKIEFQNGPLGFQLGDGKDKGGNNFVEVVSIAASGQASLSKQLKVKDILVRIGERFVRGMDFDYVIKMITTLDRPLQLSFVHPRNNLFDKNRNEYSVEFSDGEPLGITIGEGMDLRGRPFVEVLTVSEKEHHVTRNTIEVGDMVNAVNGATLAGILFDEVFTMIQAAPRPLSISFIRRVNMPGNNISMYEFSDGALGLSFAEKIFVDGSDGIFVVAKVPKSAGARFSSLRVGDQLIRIAAYTTKDMHFPDAMDLLQNLPRPVNLYFKHIDFNKVSAERSAKALADVRVYSFEDDNLGFELSDEIDVSGHQSVVISRIVQNSNAAKFKSLSVGDTIVRIETKSVQDIEKEEVVELLKQQTYRPLEVGFVPKIHLSAKEVTEDYFCTFVEGEPLGLELGDGVENGENFVEVVSVTPGGAAEKNPKMSASDRVVRVGSKAVVGESFSDVVGLVRNAPRPLQIGFRSQKQSAKTT